MSDASTNVALMARVECLEDTIRTQRDTIDHLRARLACYEGQPTIPAPPPADDAGGEDGK